MAENLSKYQKDVCDIPEPVPIKKICPVCEPNPNFKEPNWRRMVAQPYLNEKTCEYMVCVTQNKYGEPFQVGKRNLVGKKDIGTLFPEDPTTRRQLLRSYVEAGIRLMLQEYGKLEADQIICAYHHGPSLDKLPTELMATYPDFSDAYAAMALDAIGANACRDIDLPLAPALNPQKPIDFHTEMIKRWKSIENFPQIKNPLALEIYGYPKEWTFVEGEGGLLKVLVAIPAYILERVPDNPTRDEIEEEAVKTKKEVVLTVEKLWAQINRLKGAFWVYNQYQSAFRQVQGGYLYTPVEENKISYYSSVYANRISSFYDALKTVGKKNGWNIRSNIKSVALNNARLIKITFDNSDKNNPYKVSKIEAKKRGCEYEEWTKHLNLLIAQPLSENFPEPEPFDQTTWNYIAKLNEIDVALQAKKSYPWMDFLIEFTYPLLAVDYGKFSDKALEETALSCVANNAKKYAVELRDYILNESLSISDYIAYEYNKKSCTDFGDLSNKHEVLVIEEEKKAKKESIKQAKKAGPQQKAMQMSLRAIEIEREKESIAMQINNLTNANSEVERSHAWVFKSPLPDWAEAYKTITANNDLIIQHQEQLKKYDEELKDIQKKGGRKRTYRKAGREAAKAERKAQRTDPYHKLALEAALEEFSKQNSFLESVVDKATYLSSGKLSFKSMDTIDLSDITSRMTLCNLKSLTVQAVRCLFSGVTIEDAYTKIVRASLEAMDLDVFGLFIKNLPPESQKKLREEFEKEFEGLPLPWEQGYDPGSISNTNAYIKYLTKPPAPKPKEETTEIEFDDPLLITASPIPPQEVVQQPPSPKPIEHPTEEEKATADASWEGYIDRRAASGYSSGEPVRDKWYEVAKTIMNLPPAVKSAEVYSGRTSVPVDIYTFNYDSYVTWYDAVQQYKETFEGRTRLMRRETTIAEMDKVIAKAKKQLWDYEFERDLEEELEWEYQQDLKEQQEAIEKLVDEMGEEDEALYEQEMMQIQASQQDQTTSQDFRPEAQEEDTVWNEDLVKAADKLRGTYLARSAADTAKGFKEMWKELSDEERWQIIENENAKDTPGGQQGTYGTALGNIQELVVQAYIDYMIDLLEIDELMMILDRFPGSDILYKFVGEITCAYQGMFKPPIKNFMSSLTLDVCGDFGIGIGFPEQVKDISGFFDRSFMLVLKKQFVGKIEGLLTEVLKRLILKVLEGLDNALCKSLNAVGQLSADAIAGGKTRGIDDAFTEAFCPDATPEELEQTKNNLFKASGIAGSGISDQSFDGLYKTLNATTSKKEILGLLTNSRKNMDSALLTRMSQLVTALHPEFSSVFGTEEQIGQVFANVANFVPPELRKLLRDEIEQQPDAPIYDSICCTQEQLNQWNATREEAWKDEGFDPDTAKKLVDDANDKVDEDLEDLIDSLQKGTDGILADAVNSLLDPARDPGCVNDKTALIFEDENLRSEKNSLIKSLFENVERKFMRDLISGRFGILNNILRDKNNFRLTKHERRADAPFFFPNYTNSPEHWEFRKANSNILISGRMEPIPIFNPEPEPLGNYPETVGIIMKNQLQKVPNHYSTVGVNGSQINLKFYNEPEMTEASYEFNLSYKLNRVNKPSYRIEVEETFHNKLKKDEAERLGIDYGLFSKKSIPPVVSLSLDIETPSTSTEYENFNYDEYKHEYSYQSLVFQSLLEKKIRSSINTNGTLTRTFDSINKKVLNFAKNSILNTPDGGHPTGFRFGYEDSDPLTFSDVWYVNPDASPTDKSTWVYTHLPSEQVLGKSATENPRVHFLDPKLHGGSYLFPKIYVEPMIYNGWLGMVKTFIPELEECEKTDNGFLNVTQIAKRAKQVEDNLPFDERLSLAPDCRIEVPYDKHFSSASHGIMEGIVLATLKVYTTEFIIRTLPVFSGVEFSKRNVDNTFLDMLVEQLKDGLSSQTTRWNMVQGYTYYLLFLEQVVQVVQRQIIDGLMEETEEIKAAKAIINKAQQNYSPLKINLKDFNVEGFSNAAINTFKGAALIAFGENWKEDFDKVITEEVLRDLALLATAGPLGPTLVLGNNTRFAITRLGFLTPFKMRTARKINTIYQTRKAAEVYLKALMSKELDELMKKINLNMRPRPHIQDINKYLLSRNGILMGSTLRSGEMIIEQPTVEGATGFDYGDIYDVVRDVYTENPLGSQEIEIGRSNMSIPPEYDNDLTAFLTDGTLRVAPSQIPDLLLNKLKSTIPLFRDGFFYLEKYLRVHRKGQEEQVYNIKEFQDSIADSLRYAAEVYEAQSEGEIVDYDMSQYISGARNISEYFGDAFVSDEELQGSIGIKFGVRLVYCPPPAFEYRIPEGREKERTYEFAVPEVAIKFNETFYEAIDMLPDLIKNKIENVLDRMKLVEPSLSRAIPVAAYEQDIKDRKIGDIDLEDKNLGEDLKCYVDKLVETKEFQTLFGLCYPVKTYTSLFGIYSYYGFLESIGKDVDTESQEDPAKLREKWKRKIFDKTKKELRQLFNSTYRTDDDVKEEREPRSKKEKSDFLKNLLPQAFLNLDSSVQWWQQIRFVDIKPFDADGNECLNAFQKMFR